MKPWCIIPIQRLDRAKSRLSGALSRGEREELIIHMLADELNVISGAPLSGVLVVSPDEAVLSHAKTMHASVLKEPDVGLNPALELAISEVMKKDADSVLILPGDLPMIKKEDIESVIGMASSPGVVLSPSKTAGTNALLLSPPDVLKLDFGGKSFRRHLTLAGKIGIRPKVYCSFTLASDVDKAEDLQLVLKHGQGTKTARFLQSLRLRELPR